MKSKKTYGTFRKVFLFCFFLLNPIYQNFSQTKILSKKSEISLLTCDSGDQLYSLFGHTALRVKDTENAIDAVYNYGYFDFRTPNFYMKFVKGDLQYFVAVDNFDAFLAQYVYEQRGVYEQKLNLSLNQKQKIFEALNTVLTSDQRFYTYKFIDRNCTTMVADVINKYTNEKLSKQIKDSGKSYRSILYDYQKTHFYENLGINIMFGVKTDQQFDHPFLPLQLMESVRISKNNGTFLSDATKTINVKSAAATGFSFWNNWYSYILFFVLLIAINNKTLQLAYLTFAGILGIFLFWIGFYSLHQELSLNYNFLLFNPLLLFVVVFVLKNNQKWTIKSTYFCLALITIYTIVICNKAHFMMFLPVIITHIILLVKIIKKPINKN
jgi:hypothetical protein